MLTDGSGLLATLLPKRASNFPLTACARLVALSVGSITTLIPTAASCAWMNCASRSLSLEFDVDRCTVGLEKPEAVTSFFASFGLYGVQGTLVASYHAVFEGGVGLQLIWTKPPKTTLLSALRSIA